MDKGTTDLTRKTLFGLAQLVIVLRVLLVSAGSVDFWEAWVFLFIFSIEVLAITLYFLKKDMKLIEGRLKAGPSAEKERSKKIIETFVSLFFILLIVVPAIDHRFHWSDVPIHFVLVGDIFVLLMFVVIVLRLLDEEKFLSKNLPGYEEYRQKTRYRLVPFVW